MRISQVRLKGFRNFRDATINLTQKSLIIGANEIGKTNLLYALRLVLDKNFSEADLEPQEHDFCVFDNTNSIDIQLEIKDVEEDCVLAKLKEHVSDDRTTYIAYRATRDPQTSRATHKSLIGRSADTLTEVENRFWVRVLNLKYIGSSRDLFSFISRERRNLLQDAKAERTDAEVQADITALSEIETSLGQVHTKVSSLSYVAKATQSLNAELSQLSVQHAAHEVIFDTGASDPSQFVDNLRLAGRVGTQIMPVGGEGRNNQIHLALWAARNKVSRNTNQEPLEASIFCIEEPEAHLHPHQQRKLAGYLADALQAQVLITTHSPQIACAFPPESVIRLHDTGAGTAAAGNGSSPFIEQAFLEFGHRLDIIPAEAFFSSAVLLVEGRSEELLYKAMAPCIGIDLDRLNISVLMVDGVGFDPYVSLLQSLNIPIVVRTDHDIFKVPKKEAYRFAGVKRAVDIYRSFYPTDSDLNALLADHECNTEWPDSPEPPPASIESARVIAEALETLGIYIAGKDLEHDLYQSPIGSTVADFVGETDAAVIGEMQRRKATFMFAFLAEHHDSLAWLKDTDLAKPLVHCSRIVEATFGSVSDA